MSLSLSMKYAPPPHSSCIEEEIVIEVFISIKLNRAPGVDGVLTTTLKNVSDKFVTKLTFVSQTWGYSSSS